MKLGYLTRDSYLPTYRLTSILRTGRRARLLSSYGSAQPTELPCHSALTQYALRVVSDHKVIAQFGRLDASQPNLAYYCTMGYACD